MMTFGWCFPLPLQLKALKVSVRLEEYSRAKQVYTQMSANEQNLTNLRSQFFMARRDLGCPLLTVDLRRDFSLSTVQVVKI